jgi:hypothetical protein
VLQLTRMALVFTAVADGACTLLLLRADDLGTLKPHDVFLVAGIAVGLYGFGMSLNDIIDLRRDRLIAAHRPLPSGRIRLVTAHVLCAALAALAVACGAAYSAAIGRWDCFGLVLWTAALIYFYDVAGKYLVWPGLLTLGAIRFFHAVIPAGFSPPVAWHPLVLLNHVAILSTIAYQLEDKRPPLTRVDRLAVAGGLAVVNVLFPVLIALTRVGRGMSLADALSLRPGLLLPVVAAVGYAAVAFAIYKRAESRRAAGQTMVLYGLLWLIVYDAAFVAAYVGWLAAGAVLLLLPVAYLSVQLMRWGAQLMTLSQRPPFKRAQV